MLDTDASGNTRAPLSQSRYITRRLTSHDIPAILSLQEQVIGNLQPAERHFLKQRHADYLERLIETGIGIGTFDAEADDRLVAQALLRRQTFSHCETNCNVNNFLRHCEERFPHLAKILLPELHELGWGVIGTMLVSPDPAYLKKGLARAVIEQMMTTYRQNGGKHLFASTAIDNLASQSVFAAHNFTRLAEAVDPKDGWRCVILHHPPL